MVTTAWVCDDAFITLRTVDNFVNGFGLTWNIVERVQTYTHPLWMFLLLGVYATFRQPYLALMLLSLGCSTTALLWLAFKLFRDDLPAALALALLSASMAYVDYSTSGLENPLTFFLLVLFIGSYLLNDSPITPRRIFFMAALTAMLALNRLDSILLLIPAILWLMWYGTSRNRFKLTASLLAGFSPLVVWELFSLLYYGVLVPNTAYAKLNVGVPQTQVLLQGGRYFLDSLLWDPLTLLVTLAGGLIGLWKGPGRVRTLGLGILLYWAYIAWVGGDFMRGRFFAAPFLVGVILLVHQLDTFAPILRRRVLVLVAFFGFLTALIRPVVMEHTPLIAANGVADERRFYFKSTGLLVADFSGQVPDHPWVFEGVQLRHSDVEVSVQNTIGFHGFYAGPDVYIVDQFALSDPLLARLPIPDPSKWRIGHFEREIPAGYVDSLPDGENRILDPALAQFYDKIRLVTRGELLDPLRFATIINLNLGRYDDLVAQYIQR